MAKSHGNILKKNETSNFWQFYYQYFTHKCKIKQIIAVLFLLIMYKAVIYLKIWNLSFIHQVPAAPPKSTNDNDSVSVLLSSGLTNLTDGIRCIIPSTKLNREVLKESKKILILPECGNYEKLMSGPNDDKEELVIYSKFLNSNCCIQEIEQNQKQYWLSSCIPVDTSTGIVNVSNKEALIIRCNQNQSINMDFNIPIKKEIQGKLQYWQNVPMKERPMSVLLLGIDSVSRAHMYRSLPKTMAYMKTIGFTDFKKYHSIAPSTLTNFVGFLSGLTRPQVRGTCAPNWITPFDECPLIWKNFSANNYITSYMEDWGQTFSWGGQSGFVKNPTDYYVHHPFLALRKIREHQKVSPSQHSKINVSKLHNKDKEISQNLDDLNLDCASNESVPELILRYFIRFSKKFSANPFFSFIWINNPFHEVSKALSHYDNYFLKFFKSLQSSPDTFNRLLIIFLSDHGDRTGFVQSGSFDSFIERGLPHLFIRIPEIFRSKYPNLSSSMVANSDKLTTPFDVHHTLLHIASLASFMRSSRRVHLNETNKDSFAMTLDDRSSVLATFPPNRTCGQVNIPPTNCLCGINFTEQNSKTGGVSNQLLRNISRFVIQKLNFKIESSKYRSVCATWSSKQVKTLYIKKIAEFPHKYEYIMAFVAQPGKGMFEARIILFLNSGTTFRRRKLLELSIVRDMEVIGFSRINKYGDQSLCVNDKTDFDKDIKEFCMCKSYLRSLIGYPKILI